MKKSKLVILLCLSSQLCLSQTQIKTMFYNLLNFSSAPPSDRLEHLNSILSSYQPDLFMVSEIESPKDAQAILDKSFSYTSAKIVQSPFLYNTSGPSYILQHLYYDDDKFTLNYTDQIKTNTRSINHYNLKLNTSPDVFLDVFIAHFKASSGEFNENERRYEAEQLIDYLKTFEANSNIILAGDFNMYSSNEKAFEILLNGTEAFNFKDPINTLGNWNNNAEFNAVHTQSTRISNSQFEDYGAGGGLDDRFDLMLISDAIHSNTQSISYVEDTYQAWGNNANCFNNNINSMDCGGKFSSGLREALYQMSDHLPVVMTLEIDHTFLSLNDVGNSNFLSFPQGNMITADLELNFSLDLLGNRVSIFNQIGQEVVHFKVLQRELSIDFSNFATGLYYIKVDDLNEIEKFYKLN